MGSELWQRLRAARKFADMRQEDVAKWCKVSRPAVAQWEATTPEKRTMPSIDQVELISKATGVPVDWLMNNNANPEDVWQAAKVKTIAGADLAQANLSDAFTGAVKYFVMRERPDLAAGFDRQVHFVTSDYKPDFWAGKLIVEIKPTPRRLEDQVGQLLLAERSAGTRLHKMLIVSDPLVSAEAAEQIERLWDVQVVKVMSPEEAATAILRAAS